MRVVYSAAGFAVLAFAAHAQQPASGDDYLARVAKAAPPQIVEQATIVKMNGHEAEVVRKGTNQWTCMEANGVPMCADPNAMEWAHAWQTHGAAPTSTGFIYMLAGDTGASNTDPYAKGRTADNHWVETGSHVMVVGAAAKDMKGYAREADADPTKPYVMWPGSPYEHLMIPVK